MRKAFTEELADNLAKIHRITPNSCQDETLENNLTKTQRKNPNSIALEAINRTKRTGNQIPKEPHPAMELILNWLEKMQLILILE